MSESINEINEINENQWPSNIEFWQNATGAEITRFLELGADPIALINGAEHGDGPIHMAVRAGNMDAYMALRCADTMDIETRNAEGDTPLHIATTTGCVRMIRALGASGADLWSQRKSAGADIHEVARGETALFIAVRRRDVDAVDCLLSMGAVGTNTRNIGDEGLLRQAVRQGDVKLAEVAIKGRTPMEAKSPDMSPGR